MNNEIFWIDGPWLGKLAIVTRPRGDDWLLDEMQRLRKAGFDIILSLLEHSENRELGLTGERASAEGRGMQFFSFPIADRSIPASRWEAMEIVEQVGNALRDGKNVAIHCRQGIGRSSMMAAALLVTQGDPFRKVTTSAAFERIQRARGVSVPDTDAQSKWVAQLERLEKMPVL